MKKFGLVLLGITAALVAIANVGSLLALAISVAIAFTAIHFYVKGGSLFYKLLWIVVGLIGILSAAANVPGIFGILSIVALLYVVRKWKQQPIVMSEKSFTNDPFTNFENQWQTINK